MRWFIACMMALSAGLLKVQAQDIGAEHTVQDKVAIIVPAAPGGGYDRTAQALKRALLAEQLVREVEISHSPGAGGLIGLAQFIETDLEPSETLLIAGRTTLGATLHNRSNVFLSDAVPIARLVSPTIAIIVPSESRLQSFGDVAEIIDQDASLITWYGGSSGSIDEIIVRAVSSAYASAGKQAAYNAIPGGGDKIIEQLERGDLTVAVSSFEEVAEAVASGRVRILAISAPQGDEANFGPTLSELGVDVQASDWRGAFAHPDASAAERADLVSMFDTLVASPSWSEELRTNFWANAYLPQAQFVQLLQEDWAIVQEQAELTQTDGAQSALARTILDRRQRAMRLAIIAIFGLIGAFIAFLWLYRRQRKHWHETFDEFTEETRLMQDRLDKSHGDMAAHIDGEFQKWSLTDAENEIGWMLLKGLSFKEIAIARGRSERTVRQQAQSIYAKSKLQSRSDLAAHFLEDFVFGAADAHDA
ncbi:MAG: tripartite tricarboxylate transporter substrate-binding protein [Pseudomonadota bacterium]